MMIKSLNASSLYRLLEDGSAPDPQIRADMLCFCRFVESLQDTTNCKTTDAAARTTGTTTKVNEDDDNDDEMSSYCYAALFDFLNNRRFHQSDFLRTRWRVDDDDDDDDNDDGEEDMDSLSSCGSFHSRRRRDLLLLPIDVAFILNGSVNIILALIEMDPRACLAPGLLFSTTSHFDSSSSSLSSWTITVPLASPSALHTALLRNRLDVVDALMGLIESIRYPELTSQSDDSRLGLFTLQRRTRRSDRNDIPTPLAIALSQHSNDESIAKRILEAYPGAASVRSVNNGLPLAFALLGESIITEGNDDKRMSFDLIQQLIFAHPKGGSLPLPRHGRHSDVEGFTPWHLACLYGDSDLLDVLMEHCPSNAAETFSCRGYVVVVKQLPLETALFSGFRLRPKTLKRLGLLNPHPMMSPSKADANNEYLVFDSDNVSNKSDDLLVQKYFQRHIRKSIDSWRMSKVSCDDAKSHGRFVRHSTVLFQEMKRCLMQPAWDEECDVIVQIVGTAIMKGQKGSNVNYITLLDEQLSNCNRGGLLSMTCLASVFFPPEMFKAIVSKIVRSIQRCLQDDNLSVLSTFFNYLVTNNEQEQHNEAEEHSFLIHNNILFGLYYFQPILVNQYMSSCVLKNIQERDYRQPTDTWLSVLCQVIPMSFLQRCAQQRQTYTFSTDEHQGGQTTTKNQHQNAKNKKGFLPLHQLALLSTTWSKNTVIKNFIMTDIQTLTALYPVAAAAEAIMPCHPDLGPMYPFMIAAASMPQCGDCPIFTSENEPSLDAIFLLFQAFIMNAQLPV